MTTLHRFHCRTCGAYLTDWLEEVTQPELVALHASHTALVPRGYVISSEACHGRMFAEARWVVAPMSRARVALHLDLERTIGCCGLSFRNDQANLVCVHCQAEVAIGYEDCSGPHWAAFISEAGHEVEVHPSDEEDAVRFSHATLRLDEALLRASGTLHTSNVGADPRYNNICCDEPAHWERYAPVLEGVSLSLDGEQLLIRADSLAPDHMFVVATPRVMLLRLLCASITPWGEIDCPLTWRALEGDEVNVGHDVSTARVVLIAHGREATRAIVVAAHAWQAAWARLRADLQIDARAS